EANETNESKMLTGILLNQYRKYLALNNGFIDFKPIILFKSNYIKTSNETQSIFENMVKNLNVDQVDNHVRSLHGTDSHALNWFLDFYENLRDKMTFVQSLKDDFLGYILNANDDSNEERLLHN